MSPQLTTPLNRRQEVALIIGAAIGTPTVKSSTAETSLPSLTKQLTNGLLTWSEPLLCVNMVTSVAGAEGTQQQHVIAVMRDALAIAEHYTPMELRDISDQIRDAQKAAECPACYGLGEWRTCVPTCTPWETCKHCGGSGLR